MCGVVLGLCSDLLRVSGSVCTECDEGDWLLSPGLHRGAYTSREHGQILGKSFTFPREGVDVLLGSLQPRWQEGNPEGSTLSGHLLQTVSLVDFISRPGQLPTALAVIPDNYSLSPGPSGFYFARGILGYFMCSFKYPGIIFSGTDAGCVLLRLAFAP